MTVAVPSAQHSPTFGQRASSQTVCKSSARKVSFRVLNFSPPGARTLSQLGFGANLEGGDESAGGDDGDRRDGSDTTVRR